MADIDLLGWVMSSKYRTKILKHISEFTMPSDLTRATDTRFPHVSRALKELSEKGLIKIENPFAKKGRLYSLTTEGKKIREIISKL